MNAALAALSGILLGISFPKFGISLASLVAFLPLLWVLHVPGRPAAEVLSPRTAFRFGYLTGVLFFLVLLYWIPQLPRENVTIPFAMYPVLLLMVAYLSLYPALSAMAAAWLGRRGVPVGLSFPVVWTLLEVVRGTGIFGFAWGSLGYAMATYPHLVQFAEFTGLWGVTLWIGLVNGAIHRYLAVKWVAPKAITLGVLLVLVIGPYLHGRHVLGHRELRPGIDVGIVQPNVGKNKWELAVRDSVIDALLVQTVELAAEHTIRPPRLILWPETAVPARLTRNALYRYRIEALVDSIDIPILTGFPDGVKLPDGAVRFSNSAALVIPRRGITEQYDKRHLVPFSEYFPLPLLKRYDFGQSNFTPGDRPGVMTDLEIPFGVLICFESIFPGPSRELAALGARYLVNITNDQWFGDSAAPQQHFRMNILRCIENRMGMVRAANTGISGIIDPYGFVHERTETFVPSTFVGTVELGRKLTVYTRFGDWIVVVCGIVLLGFGVWAFVKGRSDELLGKA